jgi:hypothetical protein
VEANTFGAARARWNSQAPAPVSVYAFLLNFCTRLVFSVPLKLGAWYPDPYPDSPFFPFFHHNYGVRAITDSEDNKCENDPLNGQARGVPARQGRPQGAGPGYWMAEFLCPYSIFDKFYK